MLPAQQSAEPERRGEVVAIDPGVQIDVPLYWQQWKPYWQQWKLYWQRWKLHSPMLARLADVMTRTATDALRV